MLVLKIVDWKYLADVLVVSKFQVENMFVKSYSIGQLLNLKISTCSPNHNGEFKNVEFYYGNWSKLMTVSSATAFEDDKSKWNQYLPYIISIW